MPQTKLREIPQTKLEETISKYLAGDSTCADRTVEVHEIQEKVHDMLDTLEKRNGKRCRIVVEQSCFYDKTFEEIGRMLDISHSMVGHIKKNALSYLSWIATKKGLDNYLD